MEKADWIDVLNAQRTYIELQLNHLEALFEYTAALIELEELLVSGILPNDPYLNYG